MKIFCIHFQKFKHIMKELQGTIIIGSTFQTFLGYSGLMSLLVRYDCGIFYVRLFLLFFSTNFVVSSHNIYSCALIEAIYKCGANCYSMRDTSRIFVGEE